MLDEPLSALDAKVRVFLRKQIRDLQRKLGVTTIMGTHDQEEAQTMADRIFVMNEGEIIQSGTPSAISTMLMAEAYKYNQGTAAQIVFRTTLISFITIPILTLLICKFY